MHRLCGAGGGSQVRLRCADGGHCFRQHGARVQTTFQPCSFPSYPIRRAAICGSLALLCDSRASRGPAAGCEKSLPSQSTRAAQISHPLTFTSACNVSSSRRCSSSKETDLSPNAFAASSSCRATAESRSHSRGKTAG